MKKIQIEQELKKLQSMKSKIESEFKTLQHQKEILAKEITQKNNALQDINSKINKLKENSDELIISEHAILRYFERVLGFDLENIKKEIIDEKSMKLIKQFGNGEYSVGTHKISVKNNTVLTVVANNIKKVEKITPKKSKALNNNQAEELLKVLNGEIEFKECIVCKLKKELNEDNFYIDKRVKDGYKNICIDCIEKMEKLKKVAIAQKQDPIEAYTI